MEVSAQELFQIASYLLDYPTREWRSELDSYREEVAELWEVSGASSLESFFSEIDQMSEEELCTSYVQTFDFGKKTNLYVTYAQHGEERERGPALLELKHQYAKAGLILHDEELSDYLPLMLEFASIAPLEQASGVLTKYKAEIELIKEELTKVNSPYAHVLRAVTQALNGLGAESGSGDRGAQE